MKLLVILTFFIASNAVEEGNWFTKSLDYFTPANCSPLDKSDIVGGFFTCLNGAGKVMSSSGQQPQKNQPKQHNLWNTWGTSSFNTGSTPNFQNFKGKTNQNSQTKPKAPTSPNKENSEWPVSMVKSLDSIISCMPKLMEKKCLLPEEIDFYETFLKFFQIQRDIIVKQGQNVAKGNAQANFFKFLMVQSETEIARSKCTRKQNIDVNTQCYSRIVSQFQWFGWKMNWKDGKICKLINQLSACEAAAYSACPITVASFVPMLYKKSLEHTSCVNTSSDQNRSLESSGYLGYSNYFDSKRDISGYWGGYDSKLPNQNSEHRALSFSAFRGNEQVDSGERAAGNRYSYFERDIDEIQEDNSREDYRAVSHHHHHRRDRIHGKQGQYNEESRYYSRNNQVERNRDRNEEDSDNDYDYDDDDDGDNENENDQEEIYDDEFGIEESKHNDVKNEENLPKPDNERQENEEDRRPERRRQKISRMNRRHRQNTPKNYRDRKNHDNQEDERESQEEEEEEHRQKQERENIAEDSEKRLKERERKRKRERRRQAIRERLEREHEQQYHEGDHAKPEQQEETDEDNIRNNNSPRRQHNQNGNQRWNNANSDDYDTKIRDCVNFLNRLPFSYGLWPRILPLRNFRNDLHRFHG